MQSLAELAELAAWNAERDAIGQRMAILQERLATLAARAAELDAAIHHALRRISASVTVTVQDGSLIDEILILHRTGEVE